METPLGSGGTKQRGLDKHAFSTLMSKKKGKKLARSLVGKKAIPFLTPRVTKNQHSMLLGSKDSPEGTQFSSRKRKHLEVFSSNPKVIELDLSSGNIALHLRRYVQILGEHLTPEDRTKMKRLGLLAGITGVIKACQYLTCYAKIMI